MMGVQNFYFAPKFPKMGYIQTTFCIFGNKFPPAMTPLASYSVIFPKGSVLYSEDEDEHCRL